jgi:hypothetical protein
MPRCVNKVVLLPTTLSHGTTALTGETAGEGTPAVAYAHNHKADRPTYVTHSAGAKSPAASSGTPEYAPVEVDAA